MAGCAKEGGCPSDYVAVAISFLSLILLLYRSILPFVIHKFSRTKGSGFWIPVFQVFASFNLILSIVMSVDLLKFKRRHWWQSCYIWAVWIEGPVGFGLLLSCRIVREAFTTNEVACLSSIIFLAMVCSVIHMKQFLNKHCHMGAHWVIPVVSFRTLYIATLVAFTGAIRHIEFRFNEL